MIGYINSYSGPAVDVLLLPHSIYYLTYDDMARIFRGFVSKEVVKQDTILFITFRAPDDYRYNKGEKISNKTFRLNIGETREKDCIVTFFTEPEIISLLNESFTFGDMIILHQKYENTQNNHIINNCDIAFWGKIDKIKIID